MSFFFFKASVSFEICYLAPEGGATGDGGTDDERQMLIDIEHNIANLERSIQVREDFYFNQIFTVIFLLDKIKFRSRE